MTNHTTPRALVIDDDPEMRGLHKRVLAQLGFEVVLTSNATDGIEAVRQFAPTITFLDVTMPGMDGFAAAARIRDFSDTYLLMVSANTDEIDVVQGLAAGADDYIFKPFRPRELRARVEAMMRRPRALASVTPAATAKADADVWRPGQDAPGTTALQAPPAHAPAATTAPTALAVRPAEPTVLRRTSLDGSPTQERLHGRLHSRLHGLDRVGAAASALAPAVDTLAPAVEPRPVPALPEEAYLTVAAPARQLVTVPAEEADGEWVRYGSLAFHPERSVALVDGEEVQLPETELALLTALVESGVRVRSIANLVLALRGESYVTTYFVNEADKSAVKSHMASLLRRLGDTGTTPRWIESVHGVGYRMTAV